ncbi:hypothetical protein ACWDBF_21215 [Streptomyces angustmyceticus]
MATARDAIHRLFESGRTSYRLDEYLDTYRAEVRREVLGDGLNPSNLVLDAQSYRDLVTTIESTMADPDRWDGDDAEVAILGRYVEWLAAGRSAVRPEVLDEAAEVAEQVGRRVQRDAPLERRGEGAWETSATLRRMADEARGAE